MYTILALIYLTLIFGLPLLCLAGIFAYSDSIAYRFAVVLLSPLLFTLVYVVTAGLLSLPHHSAIQPGKFPKSLAHPIYRRRRLYGLCWTAVYYFKPLYFVCLSVPPLKALLFCLFGYRGSLDFTTYPDTWIRDLPLLNIGRGAYLSNRATIGTNIVLNNGYILVDEITIGEGALVGHLAMLAPGVTVGDRAEIGVGAAIGIKTKIEEDAQVGPTCTIEHGVRISSDTVIGPQSYVGTRSRLGTGLRIPAGTVIPPKSVIHSTEDLAPRPTSDAGRHGASLRRRRGRDHEAAPVVEGEGS